MKRSRLLLLLAVLMPGCGTLLPACTPKIVKVPIYKRAVPPAELSEWQPGRLPLWIGPGVTATSCLTPEGEDQLRALIWDMKTRIRAWEAWAQEEPK